MNILSWVAEVSVMILVGVWPTVARWLAVRSETDSLARKFLAGNWEAGIRKGFYVKMVLIVGLMPVAVFGLMIAILGDGIAILIVFGLFTAIYSLVEGFRGVQDKKKRMLEKGFLKAFNKMKLIAKPNEVDRFLGHILGTRVNELGGQAVWALGDWGSPEAFRMLSHFPQTRAPNRILASVWAMGKGKYEKLDSYLNNAGETDGFLALVENYYHWRRVGQRGIFHPDFANEFPHLLPLVEAQNELRQRPNMNYCTRDRRWAEELNDKGWGYIACPVCRKTDALEKGIEKVVGVVGPLISTRELERGILELNLWDAENEKAQPAEINVFELRPGGDLNYDWAVAGVLEAQKNHSKKPFQVKILEGVSLSTNSQRMLAKSSS